MSGLGYNIESSTRYLNEALENDNLKQHVQLLQMSLYYNPDNIETHYHLGLHYFFQQQYQTAMLHFQKCYETANNFQFKHIQNVYEYIGRIHYINNNIDTCIKYLDSSNTFKSKLLLANVYYYTYKNSSTAFQYLNQAMQIDQNDYELNYTIIKYYCEMKQYYQAMQYCSKLIKLNPDSHHLKMYFAEMLLNYLNTNIIMDQSTMNNIVDTIADLNYIIQTTNDKNEFMEACYLNGHIYYYIYNNKIESVFLAKTDRKKNAENYFRMSAFEGHRKSIDMLSYFL